VPAYQDVLEKRPINGRSVLVVVVYFTAFLILKAWMQKMALGLKKPGQISKICFWSNKLKVVVLVVAAAVVANECDCGQGQSTANTCNMILSIQA